MQDNDSSDEFRDFRIHYNPPPEAPREEMWEAIQARLDDPAVDVISLDEVREKWRVRFPLPLRWASAAAALLVLGIGIGRMTVTGPLGEGSTPTALAPSAAVFHAAAVDHLSRTESLLTLVRADARSGHLEPQLAAWSRTLLTQTRLLMDAEALDDPVVEALLEDLELVLVQILAAANAPEDDPVRVRSELAMALNGLEERDVLPRIQAVVPAGPGYRGT